MSEMKTVYRGERKIQISQSVWDMLPKGKEGLTLTPTSKKSTTAKEDVDNLRVAKAMAAKAEGMLKDGNLASAAAKFTVAHEMAPNAGYGAKAEAAMDALSKQNESDAVVDAKDSTEGTKDAEKTGGDAKEANALEDQGDAYANEGLNEEALAAYAQAQEIKSIKRREDKIKSIEAKITG